MIKRKKWVAIGMSILAVLSITVTSLAIFTDGFESTAEYQAGSLDLHLSQEWEDDNAGISYRPGTALKLNYTLSNSGTLATRVREMFVVQFGKAIAGTEFTLYAADDVTVAADGSVTLNTGATAINGTPNAEKTKLTFDLSASEFVINGTDTAEKVTGGHEPYSGSYVLVFNTGAGNSTQNMSVVINYLAQGLQYYNTGNDTWNDAQVLVDFTFAGETIDAVPALNNN